MQGGSIENTDPNRSQAVEFAGGQATLTGTKIQSVTIGMYVYGGSTVDGEGILVEDCPVAGIKLVKDTATEFDTNFLTLHASEIAGNYYGIEIFNKPTPFSVHRQQHPRQRVRSSVLRNELVCHEEQLVGRSLRTLQCRGELFGQGRPGFRGNNLCAMAYR